MAKPLFEALIEGIMIKLNINQSDRLIIPAPGAGLSICLAKVSSYNEIKLTETNSSGETIATINHEMIDTNIMIRVKENIGVWLSGKVNNQITLFYYIDNA